MILITHLWPSISPWNIWDLPYGVWRGYAKSHDDYLRSMEARRTR